MVYRQQKFIQSWWSVWVCTFIINGKKEGAYFTQYHTSIEDDLYEGRLETATTKENIKKIYNKEMSIELG